MFAIVWSAATAGAASPDNEFDVILVPISSTRWASIKYNTGTGEAWTAMDGKWVVIEEEKGVARGRFVVKMTGLSEDWAALRLEITTGKTWQCRQGKWVEITHVTSEPAGDAAAKPPQKPAGQPLDKMAPGTQPLAN